MTARLDGRNLLHTEYTQNTEKCRQAIKDIQKLAEAEKQTRTKGGVYQPPEAKALIALRFDYTTKLSQALFGNDANKSAALMKFLQDKVKKKPSNDLLPPGWAKLFDKILDPTKVMKSIPGKIAASNQKRYDKESPIVLQEWQKNEDAVKRGFEKHNLEIAKLNFKQLAAEMDNKNSATGDFKQNLRQWASKPSPKLQDLLAINNFTDNYLLWQNELVQELQRSLQGQPRPDLKPQFRLLCRKLGAFLNEIKDARDAQIAATNQLTTLSRGCNPKPQLPMGMMTLPATDLYRLAGGLTYDMAALAFQGPDDIARMLPGYQPPQAPPAPQQPPAALPAVAKAQPAQQPPAALPAVAKAAPAVAQAQPKQPPAAVPAMAKAAPVMAATQTNQPAAPVQRAAAPQQPHQPAAAAPQLNQQYLQQVLQNINAQNQAVPQPLPVQAAAPAAAPAPVQQAAPANAPAAPVQAKAPEQPKQNAFVSFLKRCGNFFLQILTYPYRLIKGLFTSNKK